MGHGVLTLLPCHPVVPGEDGSAPASSFVEENPPLQNLLPASRVPAGTHEQPDSRQQGEMLPCWGSPGVLSRDRQELPEEEKSNSWLLPVTAQRQVVGDQQYRQVQHTPLLHPSIPVCHRHPLGGHRVTES